MTATTMMMMMLVMNETGRRPRHNNNNNHHQLGTKFVAEKESESIKIETQYQRRETEINRETLYSFFYFGGLHHIS